MGSGSLNAVNASPLVPRARDFFPPRRADPDSTQPWLRTAKKERGRASSRIFIEEEEEEES